MKRPLGVRNDPEKWSAHDGPHEGVPDWLFPALFRWLSDHLTELGSNYYLRPGLVELLELRLRLGQLPRNTGDLEQVLRANRDLALDIVDALLTLLSGARDSAHEAGVLEFQLEQAGSASTVGVDADGKRELQRRVSDETRQAYEAAASAADRASEHLRLAWSKTYSRDLDPNAAYDNAVKAVEVAARPVVSPKNDKATLGTMIADMRNKPSKWTTVFDVDGDVEKVVSAAELLWQGMYRHGDEKKPLTHTQSQAEAAVHHAATLVHWFRSGVISLV